MDLDIRYHRLVIRRCARRDTSTAAIATTPDVFFPARAITRGRVVIEGGIPSYAVKRCERWLGRCTKRVVSVLINRVVEQVKVLQRGVVS